MMELTIICSLVIATIGFYANTLPTMKGKMISYECFVMSAILMAVYSYLVNMQVVVLFSLVFIALSIRGIYTHQYLADVEEYYNKALLEMP